MAKRITNGLNLSSIKAISMDATGTLFVHKPGAYAKCAHQVGLPNPPTQGEIDKHFRNAYYKTFRDYPCYGGATRMSNREWWKHCIKTTLEYSGRTTYTEFEFERYFRKVYQYYGSPSSYEILPDAKEFLEWIVKYNMKYDDTTRTSEVKLPSHKHYMIGITTNAPHRSIETVLPMLRLDSYFDWFVCSQDVLAEKPHSKIFDETFRQACLWKPTLQRHEVLHIGDALVADYCGARAAGFQAILIDRSDEPRVATYQDWLTSPDYPGKAEDDRNLPLCTVKSLDTVREMLLKAQQHSD